tara:strand:+ start:53 stop:334 length:282 start_codon:yes stop_codon:yes gene_type:complete
MALTNVEGHMVDTLEASKLTGPLPAISGAALTGLPASGGTSVGNDNIIRTNSSTITQTTSTIPAGANGFSVGPVSIESGSTVNISAASVWTIV